MNVRQPRLILASASLRRQELMKLLRIDFEVKGSEVPEKIRGDELPETLVRRLALTKAEAVHKTSSDAWVVSADTVVVCDTEILGKPASVAVAGEMLRKLSGRVHKVLTGVCIRNFQTSDVSCVTTTVRFTQLSRQEIDDYLDTGEPLGKAGGYAIQGYGSRFVQSITGCYFNVVGLPLAHLYQRLMSLGFLSQGSFMSTGFH